MTATRAIETLSSASGIGETEWSARVELAAAYRLAAHFGWTHLINNHISLRVPGTTDQFLVNPYGLLYEQITASNLIKIDTDGNLLQETPYAVNRAGFVIHSAIHRARTDLHCVMHTHTPAGQAVSALDCGILPLNQGAMRFYNRIGYHDLEGIAHDIDERERLARNLGPHKAMVLRNHGLITAGINVAETFHLMYHLEKTCQTQMMVLASHQPYRIPPPEVCEKTARQFYRNNAVGQRDWPALMALAEALDPSFKT